MNIPDRLPNPPRCENVFCAPMTLEVKIFLYPFSKREFKSFIYQ